MFKRFLSWLLRSKILNNKEYQEIQDTQARLQKQMQDTEQRLTQDVELWKSAYGDARKLLGQSLQNQIFGPIPELDEAEKKLQEAIDSLQGQYRAMFDKWDAAVAANVGMKNAADALDARMKGAVPQPTAPTAPAAPPTADTPKSPNATG